MGRGDVAIADEKSDWARHVVDHVEVHAGDYAESVRFYTAVLAPLGLSGREEDDEDGRYTWFNRMNVVDRRPPTTELHICFAARSRDEVDGFHRAGIDGGFRSNGEPGFRRYAPGYYAAFLLDPDGNNVEALYRDIGNPGHEG